MHDHHVGIIGLGEMNRHQVRRYTAQPADVEAMSRVSSAKIPQI